MDEEIQLINQNTRKEKFKNFILNNKKILIGLCSITILATISIFIFLELKTKNQLKIASKYNEITQLFEKNNSKKISEDLINIINEKDKTYSPLALNFLIDNKIINNRDQINSFFDLIINEIKLENEIKNLIIYKKALYNSDSSSENNLLKILKPILNSESIWRSHSLYLMSEYFLSKNEKEKSKEFLIQIIELENSNPSIKAEAQKMINRYFGG